MLNLRHLFQELYLYNILQIQILLISMCMHTHAHTRMFAHTHAHARARAHTHTRARARTHTSARAHTHSLVVGLQISGGYAAGLVLLVEDSQAWKYTAYLLLY